MYTKFTNLLSKCARPFIVQIVVLDEMKKEFEKRANDEPVTSKISQSPQKETTKSEDIYRKQDIGSLFVDVSQVTQKDLVYFFYSCKSEFNFTFTLRDPLLVLIRLSKSC